MSVCTASEAVKEAKSWVGYLEKASGKNLDSFTKNAGYNNYTIFGYDMHKAYPKTMDYPAYWCDAFFDACIYYACGKNLDDCSKVLCGTPDDYTVHSADMYKYAGRWGKTPKVGAQIFFTNNGAQSGICHTGIVESFTDSTVTTIEGNTSGGNTLVSNGGSVARKTYSRSSSRIAGYGYPKYAAEKSTPASGTAQYVVTATSLNVRDKRSTLSGKVVGTLAHGTRIKLTALKTNKFGNTWAKIASGKYKGGFIAVKFHGSTYAKAI